MNIRLGLVKHLHLGHRDRPARPLDAVHTRRPGPEGTCLHLVAVQGNRQGFTAERQQM